MKGYVYRFLSDQGGILYVGKTNDIYRRMKQHFIDKDTLYKESYDKVAKVEYTTLDSIVEAGVLEQVLINKYNCPFNNHDNYHVPYDNYIKNFDDAKYTWKEYAAKFMPSKQIFTLSAKKALIMNLGMMALYIYILFTLLNAYLF